MRRVIGCSSSLLVSSVLVVAAASRADDAGVAPPLPSRQAPPEAPAESAAEPPAPRDELLERLAQVPGLTILGEQLAPAPGFRFVVLAFTQPVDHQQPERGTFEQTLTLLHHSFDAPMVAFTTGYDLPITPFRSEVAALVDGNQLGIEERFFATSRPEPASYGDVSIYQAAADHHRVIEALKAVYAGRWLSTGGSKGGMATVYHRRFFADDLDGSVAFVAPNDVVNAVDRYDEFFEQVGTAECRERLWSVQRRALEMREESAPWMAELVAGSGCTLQSVATVDQAYELAIVSLEWGFWQTRTEADCALIPGPDAYPYEVMEYAGAIGLLWACDWARAGAEFTYQYQAATELGWPERAYPHIADLLRYPELDRPHTYVPAEIPIRFDPFVMNDIDHWVRSAGSELMFVNGENDPWGAEPFVLGSGTRDSYSYVAPGANHGYANIATLLEAEQLEAANTVRRWAGLPPLGEAGVIAPSGGARPVLEALFENELDGARQALELGHRRQL